MIKRGVIFFILSFIFNLSVYSNTKIQVNYTVIPQAKDLSGIPNNYGRFSKNTSGGLHNIIKEITKDIDIEPSFINYDDYYSALSNTAIYAPSSNPEIMLGATFSEDFTKYLDYVSVPIFTDYLVIISNKKSLQKDFAFSKDFVSDVKNINLPIIGIQGFDIPYLKNKDYEKYKTTQSALEEVFVNNKVFITTKSLIDEYLEKNKGSEKLNSLNIAEYKDFPIYYFFVINKKSSLFLTKFDEDNFITDVIFKKLQELIDNDEISKVIENK